MKKILGFWRRGSGPEGHGHLHGYKPEGKMYKAASVGDTGKIQRLLMRGQTNVHKTDRKKRTALHYACACGHPEVASLLLEWKCNINAYDGDRCTPLIKASQCQHEACVKILLENGANPNIVDAEKNSALHYTVYNDNPAIAATLLEYNADTELRAKEGVTPLIASALHNKLQLAKVLLRKAKVNAQDDWNRTALFYAIKCQSKDMIRLLLENGAVDSFVDSFGYTVYGYILKENLRVSAGILHEFAEKMQKNLHKSKKEESKGTENSSSRLTSKPGLSDFEPTTREENVVKDPVIPSSAPLEANQEQTAVMSMKEEVNLTAVDKLERVSRNTAANHPGPIPKAHGIYFDNKENTGIHVWCPEK